MVWHVNMYQSGTHVVTTDNIDKPHYYVYAEKRYEVCNQLCDWLNGKIEEPEWMKDLKINPKSNESCTGPNGINISAVGPMVLPKDDNGRLNWQTDMSEKMMNERIKIIDNLIRRNNGLDTQKI